MELGDQKQRKGKKKEEKVGTVHCVALSGMLHYRKGVPISNLPQREKNGVMELQF